MVSGYLLPHPTRQTPSRSSQPSLQASRLIIPILYYGTAPSQVGLGPGNIVLDGDPAPPKGRGTAAPTFSAHVYCGQMTGWINTAIGTGVGLGPHDIVLDGDPPPPREGARPWGKFRHIVTYCGQTAAWITTPLWKQIGHSPPNILLDGDPAPHTGGGTTVGEVLAHCGVL